MIEARQQGRAFVAEGRHNNVAHVIVPDINGGNRTVNALPVIITDYQNGQPAHSVTEFRVARTATTQREVEMRAGEVVTVIPVQR